MNVRHAAALALVGWYLMVVPTTTNAQASPTPTPPRKAADVWPTVSQAQAEGDYPQLWKAEHRAEAAIAANAWVVTVPHVKYMAPDFIIDENARQKGVGEAGIGVFVDKSENVREVAGKVPPQLNGVRVLVRAIPVAVLCLSVRLGKDVAKDCSDCAVTTENEAYSCLTKFKTEAQCELDAAKYMQDWYTDADKKGDVVVLAPRAECVENTARHRAEAAIAANAWVLKVPHVKYMTPDLILDKNARPKAVVETWIGVFVDKSKNVREVYGKVPPRLDGVLVLVREIPVLVWCLSVAEGSDCSKDSPNCVTLEGEAHSCEKEFKTQAQCELGAAKYVHDSYVDADKNGDVVVIAPKVNCWENTDPTSSQWDPTWDPTTEKVVPDNR
ncbi:hypothetical protein [Candidatus Binatus sp.]|uniref:hypothetical protein n=1 Tax=Candidatus Binatus sp. TaxID=2811406 RepID=UPI003C9EA7FA